LGEWSGDDDGFAGGCYGVRAFGTRRTGVM
jgi:hypothetical protein